MDTIIDRFLYLEDIEDPRTKSFIEEQNKRLKAYLGKLPTMVYPRVLRYLSIPVIRFMSVSRNGVYYVLRTKDSTKIMFRSWSGDEREILDSRSLGEDSVIIAVESNEAGDRLSYFYTVGGSDEGKLVIIDPVTLKLVDELEGSVGNIVWVDKNEYYYSRMYRKEKTPDGTDPPAERIFLRNPSKKKENLVFGSGLERNYMISLYRPWDKNWVFAIIYKGWESSKIYGGQLRDPDSWSLIYDGGKHIAEPVGYHEDASFILVYDGNGMGRIIRVENGDMSEVIGEKNYPLQNAVMVGEYIVTVYLKHASAHVEVYDINGNLWDKVVFDSPSSIAQLIGTQESVYFIRETFLQPPSIIKYTPKTKSIDIVVEDRKNRVNAKIEEDWAISHDGTRIHYFLIKSNKQGKASGKAIVYGYGGFGISLTPMFMTAFYPFLDDGGTIIITNLRGGGEYGEKWHEAGRKHNKQNVFEDYKAVLRKVREKGYRTIGWGVSNGGLLVAATMVQEPELFDIAIIGYPVLDMLRFHKLHIGSLWITEYGDPEDPKDREYLKKYSPYHNVRENKKYPPTLVYTGLYDDRVHPGHSLKFVAKLQETSSPAYLRVETKSGHLGATPETKAKEQSDILAFIYRSLE